MWWPVSHFAGTALDAAMLEEVFHGRSSVPIADLAPRFTDGVVLYDGNPGGLVHYSFTVIGPLVR